MENQVASAEAVMPTAQMSVPMSVAATAQPTNNPSEVEQVNLAEIKSMLDLPATATDIELITVLVNLVANLQEKYEGLLSDAVAMEDKLTNRDLADFADVIDENTVDFWREQMQQNRPLALEALNALRNRFHEAYPPTPANAENRVIPLRNRLVAINRTVESVANGSSNAEDETTAVKIRNRAHEIVRSDHVPFIIAFARAEKEVLAA